MVLQLLIVLALIALNGFFAMVEMAVVAARRARLKERAERGDKGAAAALEIAADPTRFLSTVQIGITLVSILTGAFGGTRLGSALAGTLAAIPVLAPYADALGIGLVVIAISLTTLVLGELVPKRLALANPEGLAAALARLMRVLARLAAPLAWVLGRTTEALLRLIPGLPTNRALVTDEEIRVLMREGAEAGHFEEAERAMVEMVLRLGDKRVSALMTPRTQMEVLDLDDPPEETRAKIRSSPHSRFPVIQGSLARVAGFLQTKDLMAATLAGAPFDLRALIRPAVFLPDTQPALKALEMFKRSGVPIALIVDEYGDIQGLVTLTDLLEAVVGDIPESANEEPDAVRREDGSWLIDGMMPFDAVQDLVGIGHLEDDDSMTYSTLGGFMMAQLKRIPAIADAVDVDGYRFEVLDMDGRRVDRVLVVPPRSEAQG